MGEPLVWVRAVHFAATLSVTGAVLFVALLAEPAFRKADDRGEVSARVRPGLSAIEWISLALVVVSGAAWLVIQSAQMGDVPWSEAVSEGLVQTVLLETGFGNDWIARTVLAALLAVTLAVARPARGSSRRADWLACVLAVALAGTLAWAGHAAGTPDALGVVHVASDVLHLVAASAWVGALVPLAIVIGSALVHSDPAASAVARETVMRFSMLGVVSVGTLVATGVVNSFVIVGSLHALIATGYGRLLLLKLALFLAMLSLAAVNRIRLTPIIRNDRSAAPAAFERLRTNALVEAAIGLVIVAVVGLLGTISPTE